MKNLLRNISKCQIIYRNSSDSLIEQLMLKLALLEVSGWIEVAFDNLYRQTSKSVNADNEIDKYIKPIYNFSYKKVRNAISYCVGINKLIEIETNCPARDLTLFTQSLAIIKAKRDELAHNHHNITNSYISFNDLKGHVKTIYAGIKYIKNNI